MGGGGGEVGFGPKNVCFHVKNDDGRGIAFCKSVLHNLGQDRRILTCTAEISTETRQAMRENAEKPSRVPRRRHDRIVLYRLLLLCIVIIPSRAVSKPYHFESRRIETYLRMGVGGIWTIRFEEIVISD